VEKLKEFFAYSEKFRGITQDSEGVVNLENDSEPTEGESAPGSRSQGQIEVKRTGGHSNFYSAGISIPHTLDTNHKPGDLFEKREVTVRSGERRRRTVFILRGMKNLKGPVF